MNTMKVYRIHYSNDGDNILLFPWIPENTAPGEDEYTERIPVCNNIYGCILSLGIPHAHSKQIHKGIRLPMYLYEANIPVTDLYQPSIEEVPDVWMSGELWLLKPTKFKLNNIIYIRKHMEIDSRYYSRYSITIGDSDEVIDRVKASVVYGDEKSFSFISRNEILNTSVLGDEFYVEA